MRGNFATNYAFAAETTQLPDRPSASWTFLNISYSSYILTKQILQQIITLQQKLLNSCFDIFWKDRYVTETYSRIDGDIEDSGLSVWPCSGFILCVVLVLSDLWTVQWNAMQYNEIQEIALY